MKTLVVVESPNKVAKISKCLGADFVVVATCGHFRDLPEDELGVDLTTFAPRYETLPGKSGIVTRLKEALHGVSAVLLATDADREGEAIAWHVAQVLKLNSPRRMRFQELTASALQKAVATAGPLDMNLIDAQQARRVVDRLVGYQVSPLLSVFGPRHSAGRVQSAALQLVVARELSRESFAPQAFWTVSASYGEGFTAQVALADEKGVWRAAKFREPSLAAAAAQQMRLAVHQVEAIDVKPTARQPQPPFTTSTLQQAASAQLGLLPADAMAVAQVLFEKGLITYHRTDSVALSAEALELARAFIKRDCPEVLPETSVGYRSAAGAQEAHEAIRPTAMTLEPGLQLGDSEARLYELIRRRFLACQCAPARFDITTVRIAAGTVRLLATGSVLRAKGFLHYLAEDETTAAAKREGTSEDETPLPPLALEQHLFLRDVAQKADETKAPPRFTQATLIREMQRTGIGRPSTYAATVTLLFERTYLLEQKKSVVPTPRGRLVAQALGAAFPDVVDVETTARMEAQLDEVAAGKLLWGGALREWNVGFSKRLSVAGSVLARFASENSALVESVGEASKPTGKKCPTCCKELMLRPGPKGAYLSCSGWPTCEFRADPSSKPSAAKCPKCGGAMLEQIGKFGRYARCVHRSCEGRLDRSVATAEECPRCGSKLHDKGAFLGCSSYPTCNFTVDVKALAAARRDGCTCPKCQRLLVQRKGAKGPFLACVGYPECRYTAEVPGKASRRAAGQR